MNEEQDCITAVRSDDASYITGVELAVATAAVLSSSLASLGRTTDGPRGSRR